MNRPCTFIASSFFSSQPSNTITFVRPPRNHIMTAGGFSSHDVKLNMVNYSAEWISLLSPSRLGIAAPGKIEPPRSGAVSFSSGKKLFTFGGYAEIESERHVVNDIWEFTPYNEPSSPWGWTKIDQQHSSYIPGPRLATAMAVSPSLSQGVLFGGWDPQTPGTGGVILDDVSVLDLDTLEWSQPTSTENENDKISIPGGPTSRHVAVSVCIQNPDKNEREEAILLHNHRCEDHVLMLILSKSKSNRLLGRWKRQPITGNMPSSRGLHCAAQLNDPKSNMSTSIVIFGGAAKDGDMSNEAFVLDLNTWKWTKLACTGDQPSPRAGACLCPLDESTVLLFGGAERGEEGLIGLNDVWTLSVNSEKRTGVWKCLVANQAGKCPPGRNAATLTRINAQYMLPKALLGAPVEEKGNAYFLLQGGWNPFRKTYNDVFVLRVVPNA